MGALVISGSVRPTWQNVMAHATQMSSGDTALLVIDLQEKLLPLIPDSATLLANTTFLLEVARLLEMPIQATEQYPKGLGPTVPQLLPLLPKRLEKTGFSCCSLPEIAREFHLGARIRVLVAGIEAHVCVMQTVLDLLAIDFRVYVPVDAVASRSKLDKDVALARLENAGAILTSTEACAFEWIGGSHHPRFKEISKLVQARMRLAASAV
jgi:nicotinamidase-related amidase